MLNIYKGKINVDKELEPALFAETVSIFNRALSAGFADALQDGAPLPSDSFTELVKSNIEVFSAFRVHRMQKDIAALMIGDDGKLKPFSQFAKDVKPYVSHQNRVWLETEYNTAVHRAQLASEWQQFVRDADVLPNLRWVPTTSPNVGEDHRLFWNVIRPVGDSFWSVHRPGDRWNCKCSLEQTDKEVTPIPSGKVEKGSTPSRGLDNNPGKDAKLFNEKHPYFPTNCSACPFKSTNLSAIFHSLAAKKDCFDCANLNKKVKYAQSITVNEAFIRIQNNDGNYRDNLRIIIEKGQYQKIQNRIYCAINKKSNDYDSLLSFAKKYIAIHRNAEIYILSNPEGIKSMDIIIKEKNFLSAYELKTITGKNSINHRLNESITQSCRVIINLAVDYNIRNLYSEIKKHFYKHKNALEVIIFKGKKEIKIDRNLMTEAKFRKLFN